MSICSIPKRFVPFRQNLSALPRSFADILLGFRLPVFTRRAKRELAAHPKFYLFDTGVFRSLRPRGPLDIPGEMEGQAQAGLVARRLRGWIAYSQEQSDPYFWRTRSGVEVDFVVYAPSGLWALEVKNTATIRPADLRGLKSFRDEYFDKFIWCLHIIDNSLFPGYVNIGGRRLKAIECQENAELIFVPLTPALFFQSVQQQWLHNCFELRKAGVLAPRIKVGDDNIRREKVPAAQSIAVRIESDPIFALHPEQM